MKIATLTLLAAGFTNVFAQERQVVLYHPALNPEKKTVTIVLSPSIHLPAGKVEISKSYKFKEAREIEGVGGKSLYIVFSVNHPVGKETSAYEAETLLIARLRVLLPNYDFQQGGVP